MLKRANPIRETFVDIDELGKQASVAGEEVHWFEQSERAGCVLELFYDFSTREVLELDQRWLLVEILKSSLELFEQDEAVQLDCKWPLGGDDGHDHYDQLEPIHEEEQ